MLEFFKFEWSTDHTRVICVPITRNIAVRKGEEVYEQLANRRIGVGGVQDVTGVNDILGTAFATILIGDFSTWDKIKEGCLTGIVRADNVLFLTHPICLQRRGYIEPVTTTQSVSPVSSGMYARPSEYIKRVPSLPKQVRKSTIEQEFIRKVRLED